MVYKVTTIIAPSEIPSAKRGKPSRNWLKVFNQIPVGKTWKLAEDNEDFKLSSIKAGVKAINKEAKKELFKAQQRTVEGKIFLYVTRLA